MDNRIHHNGRRKIFGILALLFAFGMIYLAYIDTDGSLLPSPVILTRSPTPRSTQALQGSQEESIDLQATQISLDIYKITATAHVEERIAAITDVYANEQAQLQEELNNKEIQRADLEIRKLQEELIATQIALPVIISGMETQAAIDAQLQQDLNQIEIQNTSTRTWLITAVIVVVTLGAGGSLIYISVWGVIHTKEHQEDLSEAEIMEKLQQKRADKAAIEKAAEIQSLIGFIDEAIRINGAESHIIPTNSKTPSYSPNRWQYNVDLLHRDHQIITVSGGPADEQGTFLKYGNLEDLMGDLTHGTYPYQPLPQQVQDPPPPQDEIPQSQTPSQENGSGRKREQSTKYAPIGQNKF